MLGLQRYFEEIRAGGAMGELRCRCRRLEVDVSDALFNGCTVMLVLFVLLFFDRSVQSRRCCSHR